MDAAVNEPLSFRDFEALVYDYMSSDYDPSVLEGFTRRQKECIGAACDAVGAMVRNADFDSISLQDVSSGIRPYFDRFNGPGCDSAELPEEYEKGLRYVESELSRSFPDLVPVVRQQNGFVRTRDNAFVFNFDVQDRNSGELIPGSIRFRYRFRPQDGKFSFSDGDGICLLHDSGSLDAGVLSGHFRKYGVLHQDAGGLSSGDRFGSPLFRDMKMNTLAGMNSLLKKAFCGKFPDVHVGREGSGGAFHVLFSGKGEPERPSRTLYVLYDGSHWELRKKTVYVNSLLEKKSSIGIDR